MGNVQAKIELLNEQRNEAEKEILRLEHEKSYLEEGDIAEAEYQVLINYLINYYIETFS